MTIDAIGAKIEAYEQLRERADKLKDDLAELNSQKDAAEAEVIAAILDAQEQTGVGGMRVEYNGRKYAVTVQNYYTIPKAHRDDVLEMMRLLGMGDLIQERVDDRTLTNELEAATEENGGELPDMYSELVDSLAGYTKSTLMRRKA